MVSSDHQRLQFVDFAMGVTLSINHPLSCIAYKIAEALKERRLTARLPVIPVGLRRPEYKPAQEEISIMASHSHT